MAIAAEELRIGNLVYGVSDRLEIVTSISGDLCGTSSPISGDLGESDMTGISPIQLSGELLERLGFRHVVGEENIWDEVKIGDKSEIWWIDGIYFFEKDCDYFQLYLSTDEDTYHMIKPSVEFVHELQNILFALTGNELMSKEIIF